jgi:hypothetical protein
MPTMTQAEWSVTKSGRNVRIYRGGVEHDTLTFDEANEFATSILTATGYKGLTGAATSNSRTATAVTRGRPAAKTAKKKGMKGGKGC